MRARTCCTPSREAHPHPGFGADLVVEGRVGFNCAPNAADWLHMAVSSHNENMVAGHDHCAHTLTFSPLSSSQQSCLLIAKHTHFTQCRFSVSTSLLIS